MTRKAGPTGVSLTPASQAGGNYFQNGVLGITDLHCRCRPSFDTGEAIGTHEWPERREQLY